MITTLIIITIVILYVIAAYNRLISKRNHVDNAFAMIDVMLKKRFDLIPNLVQTVKKYAQHESDLLTQVVKLRNTNYNELTPEQKIEMDENLRSAQHSFNVVMEQYPDLKASQNFLSLQGSLNETEEQLSASRRTYNAAVTAYNNVLQTFPSNVVASVFKFKQRMLLETPVAEKQNLNVKDLFNS